MDRLTREHLDALSGEQASPCVSLYMPTRRGGGKENPTRFRGLLSQAEDALSQRGWPTPPREYLEPARQLLDDVPFWKEQADGLAYFLSEGFRAAYRLPLEFEPRVAVSKRFLITPLLPLDTDNGSFFVLALSANRVRLLRASKETVSPVELPAEVPRNREEALATHDADEMLNFHTRPTGGGEAGSFGAIFHGHGVGIDDRKDDLLRYFQRVDAGLRPVLRQEKAPLVLAAVDYLHPLFRQACSYARLWPEGLKGSPDRLSDQDLQRQAYELLATHFRLPMQKALALFAQLHGTGRAIAGVEQAVPATQRGKVELLFLAKDRQAPGPEGEDLLNVAAAETLRHGGTVYVVPADQVPGDEVVSAIHWLPLNRHGKGR